MFFFLMPSHINAENNEISNYDLNLSKSLDAVSEIKSTYSDENYGGMYIDENGNLHALLNANKLTSLANTQAEINVKNATVKIETYDYSLKEMKNALNELSDLYYKYNLTPNRIYLDEQLNKVVVEVTVGLEYPNEILETIKNPIYKIVALKDSAIVRKEVDVYIAPGYAGYDCTVAFMAKRNGVIGFVTAGHCISVGQRFRNSLGGYIGICAVSIDNSTVDAAFVEATGGTYVPSRTAKYSGVHISGVNADYIVQGAQIHLEGKMSGHQVGLITSTSATIGTQNGVITTSYDSQGGDSGGTMWVSKYNSSTEATTNCIVGVHNGSYTIDNTRVGGYGSRITNVLQRLGVSYYGG